MGRSSAGAKDLLRELKEDLPGWVPRWKRALWDHM